MSKVYRFTKNQDGSYLCESSVPGDGSCLVRRVPGPWVMWETAEVPTFGRPARYSICPVSTASAKRSSACDAHFFYFNDFNGSRRVAS